MEQKTIDTIERYNRILEGATKVAVAIMIHTAMSVLGDSEVEVSIAAASNAVELFYFTPLGMAEVFYSWVRPCWESQYANLFQTTYRASMILVYFTIAIICQPLSSSVVTYHFMAWGFG
eukprot:scaffold35600_cov233-Skeletonema_dohrnii-CCMP3373.AAC.2